MNPVFSYITTIFIDERRTVMWAVSWLYRIEIIQYGQFRILLHRQLTYICTHDISKRQNNIKHFPFLTYDVFNIFKILWMIIDKAWRWGIPRRKFDCVLEEAPKSSSYWIDCWFIISLRGRNVLLSRTLYERSIAFR